MSMSKWVPKLMMFSEALATLDWLVAVQGVPKRLAGPDESARIASNIVVGVGFLGGGVILRRDARVTGLTTAATIWSCPTTMASGCSFRWREARSPIR